MSGVSMGGHQARWALSPGSSLERDRIIKAVCLQNKLPIADGANIRRKKIGDVCTHQATSFRF